MYKFRKVPQNIIGFLNNKYGRLQKEYEFNGDTTTVSTKQLKAELTRGFRIVIYRKWISSISEPVAKKDTREMVDFLKIRINKGIDRETFWNHEKVKAKLPVIIPVIPIGDTIVTDTTVIDTTQ